jgi:hypothetical protein
VEVHWVDSCGENSLHRLCQLVRFAPHEKISHDDIILMQNHRLGLGQEVELQGRKSSRLLSRPLPKRNYTHSTLVGLVQQFLLEADSTCASISNNWGETPLHQFVRHCGFPETVTAAASDTTTITCETTNSKMAPSIQFLDGLIQAHPKSVEAVNYLNQLPLHEACLLPPSENRIKDNTGLSIPYSNLSMRQLGVNFAKTSTSSSTLPQERTKLDSTPASYSAQVHFHVIERLLEAYEEGVLVLDSKGRSPLCRAVQSIRCSPTIVKRLLEQMEVLFTKRNKGPVSILLRRAILGWDANDEKWERNGSRSEQEDKGMGIVSPLKELWDIVKEPRRLDDNIPWLNHSEPTISIGQIINFTLESHMQSPTRSRDDKDGSLVQEMKGKACLLTNQIGLVWEKVMVLLCTAYHGSVTFQQGREIHAAIYCGAPRCIMRLALCQYNEQLVEVDNNGDTPLSLAISRHRETSWATEIKREETDDDMNMLQMILWADPISASIPNKSGRLPLHSAIDNGICWRNGTEDILKENPDAASVRDEVTGLFPFMLASGSERFVFSEDELLLSRVFDLLQTDPSVVCDI